VAGLVRDADGRPVAEARVITSGAEEVRTGVDGRFVMPRVPIGTREINVLAIGAQPVTTAADVSMRDTAFVSVELRKIVELPAVVVTAKTARQRMLAEIEERKALGLGHFMDSAQVEPLFNLQYATRMMLPSPRPPCLLFFDGVAFIDRRDIANELYLRSPLGVAMIEAHRGTDVSLPYRYKTSGKKVCDGALDWVLLVWTKNWLP
jgi:hypothetical protein